MTCSEFFQVFSDYHDGVASDEVTARVEGHLESCGPCRQYQRVMAEGLHVLRASDEVDVPGDFDARLRHRLLHVDEEDSLLSHAHSGATALAVLSIAVVLTAVAWSPLLRPDVPQVDVAPLVVSAPRAPIQYRALTAFPFAQGARVGVRPAASAASAGLFEDAPMLLFEYSRLSQRYRQPVVVRQAGLEAPR